MLYVFYVLSSVSRGACVDHVLCGVPLCELTEISDLLKNIGPAFIVHAKLIEGGSRILGELENFVSLGREFDLPA